jgi:hypothetical protein
MPEAPRARGQHDLTAETQRAQGEGSRRAPFKGGPVADLPYHTAVRRRGRSLRPN